MLIHVANRTSPLHEALRQALWTNQILGRELHVARVLAGKTQKQVARQLGRSASEISRREHGQVRTLSIVELSRHGAAVGLRTWVRVFPAIRRPLDGPQLKLLEAFRTRIGDAWEWDLEMPIPIKGDLRAADARLRRTGCTLVVEAITRFADVQAQARAGRLKRRDLGADRLILLVSATSANRAAVRSAGPMLAEAFPVGTWRALRALAAGEDPGGDALILLQPAPAKSGSSMPLTATCGRRV